MDKKKENLEKIEATISKEQKNNETFSPVINHRKKDGSRRNLTNFLKAQNEFQKRVEKKKKDFFIQKEDKIKKLNLGKPKLDKISEEMVKKNSTNEPVYMRLYNKRYENEQKIKQIEEKIILKEKEKEQKRKEQEEEFKRNNPYKHIKSKFNSINNNYEFNKHNSQKQIYKPKRNIRGKSAENIRSNNYLSNYYTPDNKINLDYKIIPLNKVLFNKFNLNFEEAKEIMKKELKENKNENNNIEELDEQEYYKFLIIMGMVHDPKEQNDNDTIDENSPNFIEKNLVSDTYNLLKINGEKIKLNDVRNFLICIIGLQNYNLYQLYKTNHEQELKTLFPTDKYKKEEIPELILAKYNEELNSKIDKKNKKNNKYISLSKENKIIFTLEKAFLINRDFHRLAVNYRSQKKKNKVAQLNTLVKTECPFKPEISEKSNLLYQKYKDKIFSTQYDTVSVGSVTHSKKTNMDYMDLVLLLDRKKIANNQKIKEEMEQKRIKECTFRPNISNYNSNNDTNRKNRDNNNYNNNDIGKKNNSIKKIEKRKIKDKNIFDELYEDGIKKLKLKKDKTKEQVELEEQEKEFTFQPKIKNLDPKKIPKTYFKNNIYNEREYKIWYERLKHGRLERMVKEGNNDRYGLNNELKKFVKDNKEFNYLQNHQYYETDDPFYYDSAELNNMITRFNTYIEQNSTKKVPHKKKKNLNKSQEVKHKNKITYEESNNIIETNPNNNNINNTQIINNNNFIIENNKEEKVQEEEINKKEEMPLLIIDVNIGNGVKKKIYVFEGDTSDVLAENFAKENNLDKETKNKLQNLIQKHMETILSRIVEENQSNSEQYQNYDPIIK